MAGVESKPFDEPDELVELPYLRQQVVVLGETHVAWSVAEPGWRWRDHVKPVAGTATCHHHHQGVAVSGQLEVETDLGARRVIRAGEAFDIPPGHDARVVGDEPFVSVEFTGVRGFGKAPEIGERIVATLLVTDIVDSTRLAASLGDARWKQLLSRHAERVRGQLDRFHGHPIAGTGDGVLALFDGAARAVRCAAAIRGAAAADELHVRAGVHSGEVERQPDNVRGVAVHAVARIAALADADEVLVSAPTVSLLEGSGLEFADAGEHTLRGLPGRRQLYRLAG